MTVLAAVCFAGSFGMGQESAKQTTQSSASQLPSPAAGSNRCIFCHPREVDGYARSTMAHSLRRSGREPEGIVEVHGSKITMRPTASGYWQRWENAVERNEYRIDYVIGSGTHAAGYLANVGGHLFQSPVAFYTSRQSYDLAPGYEQIPDPDFTRPVSEECVLCHSGAALHVPGTLNQYEPPIFPAEAITCERCHGPVERHLADPRAGTIVNPAKLEAAARDSVCEQCHLLGVARVPNPGKKVGDFVPGQRAEDTFTIYHDALPPGFSAGSFKVISHVEQLALSACARNSAGRLWCGTCHDPHDKPSEPLQHYRSKCLACHTTSFPASHPSKDTDCLACHMPRRNAQDGGHTVFTDHRIQRRPAAQQDLPPDTEIAAWREPPAGFQRRNLGIAYIAVGMERHSSSFIIQGYRNLMEVQKQFQDDSEFLKWIGDALLIGKQTADAKFAFERALQLDPNSPVTEASAASPYIQLGEFAPAIRHLSRAVSLDPFYLPAVTTLIGLYEKNGNTAEASALATTMKAAIDNAASPTVAAPGVDSVSDSSKNAEFVFRNIQVLKRIPAVQLMPAMQFISSSLGVACTFCHIEGHFEKDDKKAKQTARKMMQMTLSLNQNSFRNQREVTCYSCHRGARDPVATPTVNEETLVAISASDSETFKLPANLPTVSQLLENYVRALGGASAIEKITTRIERGTEISQGHSSELEIFTRTPAQQASVRHFPNGESSTVIDGQLGWFSASGRAVEEIHGADLDAGRADADLHFPLHFRQFYPDLRLEYPEIIAGQETYVLIAVREGQAAARFYFDEKSALLVRVVRYTQSPLGAISNRIDYSDYRDIDSIRIPFRMAVSWPGKNSSIQIESVQQNVAIEDTKFVKPPSHPSHSGSRAPSN